MHPLPCDVHGESPCDCRAFGLTDHPCRSPYLTWAPEFAAADIAVAPMSPAKKPRLSRQWAIAHGYEGSGWMMATRDQAQIADVLEAVVDDDPPTVAAVLPPSGLACLDIDNHGRSGERYLRKLVGDYIVERMLLGPNAYRTMGGGWHCWVSDVGLPDDALTTLRGCGVDLIRGCGKLVSSVNRWRQCNTLVAIEDARADRRRLPAAIIKQFTPPSQMRMDMPTCDYGDGGLEHRERAAS